MSKSKKITSGTGEWANSNVNPFKGCSNGCPYCYAMKMALRFERIASYEEWLEMKPNKKAIEKSYKKRNGRIMFPSSHDITPETYPICLSVLLKLLKAGNEVLITTKPNLIVITKLTRDIEEYKDQVQFRFTITSMDAKLLAFFEPHAPPFKERMLALSLAYHCGFKTSISIEPNLERDPFMLIKKVAPYVTESIWFGIMTQISRTIWPDELFYYNYIREINEIENLQKILNSFKYLPVEIREKIRIKDTIRNLFERKGLEVQF